MIGGIFQKKNLIFMHFETIDFFKDKKELRAVSKEN